MTSPDDGARNAQEPLERDNPGSAFYLAPVDLYQQIDTIMLRHGVYHPSLLRALTRAMAARDLGK